MNTYEKNKIIEDERKIIGIEPIIDIEHFALLFITELVNEGKIYKTKNHDLKIASLPSDYISIIDNIMHDEDKFNIKFAEIIDIYSYYNDNNKWKKEFADSIKNVFFNKSLPYIADNSNYSFSVSIKQEEINKIKSEYDLETLEIMKEFVTTFNNCRIENINNNSNKKKNLFYKICI